MFQKRICLPWIMSGISTIKNRPKMLELQTITHKAFKPLVVIFQDKTKALFKKQYQNPLNHIFHL